MSEIQKYLYECVRCQKKYVNKIDIERHLNIKNKCRPIKKNYIFNNEQTLKLSLIKLEEREYFFKEKEVKEDDIICTYCFNFYNTSKLLIAHKNICKLKNCHEEYKKMFDTLKDINEDRVNIIKANEIKNINEDFDISHFTDLERYSVLNEPSPINVIKYIYNNNKNINFLNLNDKISCVIYNNEINKMDNDLIYQILIDKIKKVVDDSFKELSNSKKINYNSIKHHEELIDVIYKFNHKEDLFNSIKNIHKKIQIEKLFIFSNKENVQFENIDKLKIFCLNEKINFIEKVDNYEINLVKKTQNGKYLIFKRNEKNGELFLSEYFKNEDEFKNNQYNELSSLWKPVTLSDCKKFC